MRWDALLLNAAKDGFRDMHLCWHAALSLQISKIESAAREAVAKVLVNCSANYPVSRRAKLPLDERSGSVISLNFDTAWLQNAESRSADYLSSVLSELPKVEQWRLGCSIKAHRNDTNYSS